MACKYLATVNSQVFNVLNVRENRGSSSITVYLRFLKHPIRTVVSERILKQRVNNPRKRTLQNLSQQPAETKKTRDLGIESRSQPFLSLSNFKPWCSSWPTSKGKRERGREREREGERQLPTSRNLTARRGPRENGVEKPEMELDLVTFPPHFLPRTQTALLFCLSLSRSTPDTTSARSCTH